VAPGVPGREADALLNVGRARPPHRGFPSRIAARVSDVETQAEAAWRIVVDADPAEDHTSGNAGPARIRTLRSKPLRDPSNPGLRAEAWLI